MLLFVQQLFLQEVFAYEVRIIRSKDRDVVTNVFGLSAIVFNPQEGNNVLQHDLAKLDLK